MKLICGDCLDVLPVLPKVALVLTDPPYGATQNAWDSVIDLPAMWSALDNVCRSSTPIVLFAKTPFDKILGASNIKNLKYEWIWEKSKASGFLNAKKMPLSAHENILVFSKGTIMYSPQMSEGKPYNKGVRKNQEAVDSYGRYSSIEVKSAGSRYPRSVLYFQTAEREGKLHKTQKPVALMEYLIKTYTLPGETVLDFCMGSGSTGAAAMACGRNFIGIEKDAETFEIAKKRLQ